jgi:hypothetical protein
MFDVRSRHGRRSEGASHVQDEMCHLVGFYYVE